jgi:hypothetical protein
MIAEEATDKWTTLDVIEVKREGEALAIVTSPATFLIGPLNEFAEQVVDLIGDEDGRESGQAAL